MATQWQITIDRRKYVKDKGEKYSGHYEYWTDTYLTPYRPTVTNPRGDNDRFVVVSFGNDVLMLEKQSVTELAVNEVGVTIIESTYACCE